MSFHLGSVGNYDFKKALEEVLEAKLRLNDFLVSQEKDGKTDVYVIYDVETK